MAIGAITAGNGVGQNAGPISLELISFTGDASYPAGGTTGFQALVRAAVGKGDLTILAAWGQDAGGFTPVYDKAADKLKVFRTGAVNAAQEEVPATTNLSATTFNVMVLSQ